MKMTLYSFNDHKYKGWCLAIVCFQMFKQVQGFARKMHIETQVMGNAPVS